jgi:UDP-N-acetylmuramate dehydrogenase
MQIQKNISLKPLNTFGINVKAKSFAAFSSVEELIELIDVQPTTNNQLPTFVLGGGSNILFTQDYDGLVIKNEMTGIEMVEETYGHYYVKAAAGENWHQFVLRCIKNNYAGVENLSLIPGNVGASPMQNIGAYGVELKDVFHQLEAYHIEEKSMVTFRKNDCEFGYRESIFKRKHKNKFIITSVTFRLNKTPEYKISYGAIQQELEQMNVEKISIKAISDAVIQIRKSKLPDPEVIGNAGSFFKNPTIPQTQFDVVKLEFPLMVGYPANNAQVKVAAGWLIEQCGWKGYRKGDAGCHEKQALVLVNYGNASGLDIYTLSTEIMNSVEKKFGIILEREVNVF